MLYLAATRGNGTGGLLLISHMFPEAIVIMLRLLWTRCGPFAQPVETRCIGDDETRKAPIITAELEVYMGWMGLFLIV